MRTENTTVQTKEQKLARFNFIYENFAGKIYTLFYKRGYDSPDDLCQGFFLKLWLLIDSQSEKIPQSSSPTFRGWLYQSAKYFAIDEQRKLKRKLINSTVGDKDITQIPDSSTGLPIHWGGLSMPEYLLSCLSPLRRRMVLLAIQGYEYQYIANKLNVSHATVRNELSRARQKLISIRSKFQNE